MSNENVVQLPATDDTPEEQLRWCRSGVHLISTTADRCKPCAGQSKCRAIARRAGAPFCAEGHGLVRGNLAVDGSCAECARFLELVADPETPVRPAPSTWLDWAAVVQGLEGRPLTRPLTTREIACLCTTLQERDWTRADIAAWLDATGVVPAAQERYVEYVLVGVWHRRYGYPDPRITVQQAVYAEADGDLWIAEAAADGELEVA